MELYDDIKEVHEGFVQKEAEVAAEVARKEAEVAEAAEKVARKKSNKRSTLMLVLALFPFVWCFFVFGVLGFKSVDDLSAAGFVIFLLGLVGPWLLLIIMGIKGKPKQ
jgi:hypothetical protein